MKVGWDCSEDLVTELQTRFYIITSKTVKAYLLTPWCRVLIEKLTGLQLVKKFPAFHGTRRLITVLTSVRHLSVSWASPIQSIYPHPTSWRSVPILSTHLYLGLTRSLIMRFPHQKLVCVSLLPYVPHVPPVSLPMICSLEQYTVWSTNHEAPPYAIFSILFLLRPS